jgi:putative transposase
MPRPRSVSIRRVLRKFISRPVVASLAVATGTVRRNRKVDPYGLVWSLILGFAAGRVRTLASLRRVYERATGCTLQESSFYQRFTPGLVKLLRALLDQVIEHSWGVGRQATGRLSQFRDILVTDSSLVRLHDLLAGKYPGTRTNHSRAAAKLHVLMCVAGAGKQSIKITSGKKHDRRVLTLGPWVRGKLLLFDLGYFDYQLFRRLDDLQGYFVTRLKRSANPVIVEQNRLWRGRSVPVISEKVWDVVERLQREELDVMVQVRAKYRAYAGRGRSEARLLRVVGCRDASSGQYHLYLTNIGTDTLTVADIARTYALRWEVELLFKELKTHYRLDQLASRNPQVVEALLYAALLSLAASRALRHALRDAAKTAIVIPQRRWAALVSQYASDLLLAVITGREDPMLVKLMLYEGADPTRTRPNLLQAVEQGLHSYSPRPSTTVSARKAA